MGVTSKCFGCKSTSISRRLPNLPPFLHFIFALLCRYYPDCEQSLFCSKICRTSANTMCKLQAACYENNGLRLCRSHLMFMLVPQILEEKRVCLQCRYYHALFTTWIPGTGYHQYVELNWTESQSLQEKYGVPQGSLFGPRLFSISKRQWLFCIDQKNSIYDYVEDTTASVIGESAYDVVWKLKLFFAEICSWCNLNRLTLHTPVLVNMKLVFNDFVER